jgi:two-component system, NarL family, sensor histidine kinase DegS
MDVITKSTSLWKRESAKSIRNPHLWMIFSLIVIISLSYYLDFIFINDNVRWLFLYRVFEYKYHVNGILLYIPLIYSAVIFGWAGITFSWLFALAMVSPQIVYLAFDISSLLFNIMILTIPVLIVLLIVLVAKWVQLEVRMFAEREIQRQAFTSQILKAHEDERKTIARELHDDSIQSLRAIASRLQSLLNEDHQQVPAHFKEQLELSRDTVYHVSEDLRRLSVNLRPSILDDLGLVEALRSLVDKFNSSSIKAKFIVEGNNRKLSPDADVVLFRFVQEALTNIGRHSEATEASVELDYNSETVNILVRDNGRGFTLPEPISKLAKGNKFGIIGMQERARILNGDFKIFSNSGEGTSVSIEFKA